MPTTDLNICNIALRSIGQKKITSLDQEIETARILNDIYAFIRDEVMEAHPWSFALKRTTLTALGGLITTWTQEGTANVWQAALTTEPAKVKFDGTTGTKQTSIAACNTENYWYWESDILYVYAASDPDTLYTNPGIFATIPEFDYDYAYALPSSCLRVTRMSVVAEFKVEGDKLLTDETSAKIQYIEQVTDPTKFKASFVTAFASRLAAEIAYPIASSNTLAEAKLKEYTMKLRLAKSADSQRGTSEREEEISWITDRE